MAKASYIEEGRPCHLLKAAAISGESPLRSVALFMTVYSTGIMLTEISTLPVRPYLNGHGSTRVTSCVDCQIAYNGKERPLYWSNPRVANAIDVYLTHRVAHRQGTPPMVTAYRGMHPDGRLFLTGEGAPYKLIERRTGGGTPSYSCDSLSQHFRKLHLQADIEGASAMSGRRLFAVRSAHNGYDLRHFNELLGHETWMATKRFIDANPVRLGAIVARVLLISKNENMNQVLYGEPARLARSRLLATYSEVSPLIGLSMDKEQDRDEIARLLGEIAEFEHDCGRPMLSALIVHRGNDNNPEEGFFLSPMILDSTAAAATRCPSSRFG